MNATREHGSIGENIKVHFAGCENMDFANILHEAGVNYFLFTVLAYLKNEFAPKWGSFSCAKDLYSYQELPKISKHSIMDSGLFTLMFGAGKDIQPDEAFIRRYFDAYCNFVTEHHLDQSIACVECDCQKLLGTDLAWELRQKMRDRIPNTVINVFHFEDGKYGMDRMIEFSDYMAISVPELRIVKPKTYKEDTYRIACYIKNKKPEIDLHLLGCTEIALLKRCRFATSADSTSWQQVNRYGRILGYRTSQIKEEKVREGWEHIKTVLKSMNIEPTEKRIYYYYYYYYLAGLLLKREYTKAAGNQD